MPFFSNKKKSQHQNYLDRKFSEKMKYWENDFELFSKLIQVENNSRWFVPLCGSSPVVKFLWEKGFNVVCNDLVETAVINLKKQFEGVEFHQEKLENDIIKFTSSDKRVFSHF